jgi:hypothetical protein
LAGAIDVVYQRQVFLLEVFMIVEALHMLGFDLLLPPIFNITVFTMFLEAMVENWTMASRNIVNTVILRACKLGDNIIWKLTEGSPGDQELPTLFLELPRSHMLMLDPAVFSFSVRRKITQKADPKFIFRSRDYLDNVTITFSSRAISFSSRAISLLRSYSWARWDITPRSAGDISVELKSRPL